MTSLKLILRNHWSFLDFTFMMSENGWKLPFMPAARAVMLVKKVTYFGEFSCFNSSCIRKSIILMFEFLERKFHAFVAKLSDRCYRWLPTAMLEPIRMGTSGISIQISINLSKTFSSHILHNKSCCELNLGESLCIFPFFIFSDSGLYLLNAFDCYFDLFGMAWHWKPAIWQKSSHSRWQK